MNKKQSKRQRDIKSKLIAAICMLMVSSIMMVSTTYAWFTLSTAPEVTGINTAVGANGNLEMALQPSSGQLTGDNGIKSEVGDSSQDKAVKNITWGNLVDLNHTSYGLEKITLYPAALNLDVAGKIPTAGGILATPAYGADGRVSELVPNTTTGTFDSVKENFSPNTNFGVRAVGNASGMTDRQLSYRNARAAANTAKSLAANLASQSLMNNGGALAKIAILHAAGNDDNKYTRKNVAGLRAIINDLEKDGGVLDQIANAYKQYILAYAASSLSGTEDTVWTAVAGKINSGAALSEVQAALSVGIPDQLNTMITEYLATVEKVTKASTAIKVLEDKGPDATFTWEQIRSAMSDLADPSVMTINDMSLDEAKNNIGSLATGTITVGVPSGGGVYADIADHCGNYSAKVTVTNITYGGITLEKLEPMMETKCNKNYLTILGTGVENKAPENSGGNTDMPISDMYGYIIDLAFRTNAADSNLLLQVDAADRIYSDNTNEDTMGHGSSMTFMATTGDLTTEQLKSLMSAIRIVFFDTSSGDVKAYAKLDVDNATFGADGWTAKMYLYETTAGTTTTTYDVATEEQKTDETTKLYTMVSENTYAEVTDKTNLEEGTTYYVATTTTTESGEQTDSTNTIMALNQNTATALSVLVYLDGHNVGNDDVAATASTSMTGKMNLQFASSAKLVPMEYADLHQASATTEPETSEPVTP